jgi:hypothetical protein
VSGVVTVTRADDGLVITTAHVPASGSFLRHLAPGVYQFTADCQTTASEPTAITADTTTNVVLWCACMIPRVRRAGRPDGGRAAVLDLRSEVVSPDRAGATPVVGFVQRRR